MGKITIFLLLILNCNINAKVYPYKTTYEGLESADVWAGTTGGVSRMVSDASSDPTSSSDPINFYTPIDNGNGQIDAAITSSIPLTVVNNTIAAVTIYHDHQDGERSIWVAYNNNSGSYTVANIGANAYSISNTIITTNSGEDNKITIYFDIAEVCNSTQSANACAINISNFNSNNTIYVFTDSSSTDNFSNSGLDVSSKPNGIYYKMSFSDLIPTPAPVLNSTTPIKRGDSQATIIFTGNPSNQSDGLFKTLVYYGIAANGDFTSASEFNFADIRSTNAYRLENPVTNSAVIINNLSNGTTYSMSVAQVNKFQLATRLPPTQDVTPTEIEAFLREQSCYLISAGFGEEHFVIDYFKNFRDKFLAHTYLGKNFISWYYSSAPSLAPFIYKNPPIAFVVRMLSYGLYFIMNYFFYLLIVPLLLISNQLIRDP